MASTNKKLAIGMASASLTGVALAMGVGGAGGAVAAAMSTKPPPVNADNYTLSCQQVSGKENVNEDDQTIASKFFGEECVRRDREQKEQRQHSNRHRAEVSLNLA